MWRFGWVLLILWVDFCAVGFGVFLVVCCVCFGDCACGFVFCDFGVVCVLCFVICFEFLCFV